MYADAVIEGGGVKAIGLVGAIYEAEKRGYQWKKFAGTSAGAMIAALLAAGYTAEELKEELMTLDYSCFIEKKGLQKYFPFLGAGFNLWRRYGVFNGDYIEQWVREKLLTKGVVTFEDLKKPLYIIASDISGEQMLVLPNDIKLYGINPATLEVATAVRMSTSLPFFYQPVKLRYTENKQKVEHYIVDGGILSNFPVWIFDQEKNHQWPTFGFRLVTENYGKPQKIKGLLSLGMALVGTMMEAHDARHIKNQDYIRTILVPTLGVKTTDFNITEQAREGLFQSGVNAASKFFDQWSFNQYINQYNNKNKSVIVEFKNKRTP